MTDLDISNDVPDFSLVKGGPVYRLFRWSGLCNEQLDPIYRRIAVIAAVAWLPLLLLSLFEGRALGGADIPFLYDIENQVRFLVALPLLLAAESVVERVLSPRIKEFTARNIVRRGDLSKFKAAIASAHKMRDSVLLETVPVVFVLAAGRWVYSSLAASPSPPAPLWYASPDGVHWNLSLAGYWLASVSLPLFQFFLLRWYARIVIWFVFLLRVSRLDLNLIATHSDRAAGLGFLTKCAYSFSYVLLAQGALLSGYIAGRAMHYGQDVRGFRLEAAALALFLLATVLVPLSVFTPKLLAAKWQASDIYGALASRYVEGFDAKWIGGVNPEGEDLLGTGDIQSLADLSNSYAVIEQMKMVPFGLYDAAYLAAMILAPLLPLALFVFSAEELVEKLIKILM